MVGKLLLRGMLVGLVAGILAFAFARAGRKPLRREPGFCPDSRTEAVRKGR